MMRRVLFTAALVAVMALFLDVMAGYFLFYFQKTTAPRDIWAPGSRQYLAYSDGATPSVAVAKTLRSRLRPAAPASPAAAAAAGDDFKALFKYDERLGWSATPGRYRFLLARPDVGDSGRPRHYEWSATILDDGSRATGSKVPPAKRSIHVFGDSWVFGWALDDELTLGWRLQDEYKGRFKVISHAGAGWGHTHALLKFRKIKAQLTERDIVVVGYAQFLLPRNAPQPSVIASLATGLKHYAEGPDRPLGYTYASLKDGVVSTGVMPLDCERVDGYCKRPERTLEDLEDLTVGIFDEILDGTKARVVVLHMDGPDDRVLKHLASRGVKVVDGRPRPEMYSKDDMNPYDAHPGPLANHYWFKALRSAIDRLEAGG